MMGFGRKMPRDGEGGLWNLLLTIPEGSRTPVIRAINSALCQLSYGEREPDFRITNATLSVKGKAAKYYPTCRSTQHAGHLRRVRIDQAGAVSKCR